MIIPADLPSGNIPTFLAEEMRDQRISIKAALLFPPYAKASHIIIEVKF
jgi:hypothetical protein